MPTLKQGSKGPEVISLQTKLKQLGFDPGTIDGRFGSATTSALIAFQRSRGLDVDGKAGPQTMSALQLNVGASAGAGSGTGTVGSGVATAVTATRVVPAVAGVTVGIVAKMFPGTKVANIKANLPIVLQALVDAGLADKDMILMALATIRAETASFMPVSEDISRFNTTPGKHAFNKYDNRLEDLGNRGRPDGASFKGRGFIQLTGRSNYQKHGSAIGLGNGLIENPELANQPDIAAKLLASFIRNKEKKIRKALSVGDLKEARRLVNGGSHGLDEFKRTFKIGQSLIAL